MAYPKARYLAAGLCAGDFVLFAFLAWRFPQIGLLWLIPFYAGLLVIVVVTHRYGTKKLAAVNNLIATECRPDKAVAEYRRLCSSRYPRRGYLVMLINLTTALISAGQMQEAEKILNGPELGVWDKKYKPNAANEFAKNNNRFVCRLRAGDLSSACEYLERMHAWLEQPVFSKRSRRALRTAYEHRLLDKSYVYRFACGQYEGVETYLTQELFLAKTLLEKVALEYRLGELYLRTGQPQQALPHLTRARDNGGTTWYATRAAQLLQEAQQPEPQPGQLPQ